MFTTATRTRSTLFAVCALALAATLCPPAAMANDSFDNVMKDAVARNDAQILPDQYKGGASFTRHIGSEYRGVETSAAFRSTMQDAVARNDKQLLPEQYVGGGTFVTQSGAGMTNDNAFRSTMRDAIARNDSQILPDHHTGGASFLR